MKNGAMKIGTLAQWYGSNRYLAEHVGAALRGCEWVGVPFAGGMCELPYIEARTVIVADKHAHVINLALAVADESMCQLLSRRLDSEPFHEALLVLCQRSLREREEQADRHGGPLWKPGDRPDYEWAFAYFFSVWASRAEAAGTRGEFDAGFSVRWTAGGGDSCVRFRNAAAGLKEWQQVMRRCTFVCLDVFEFLAEAARRKRPGHGLYLDPPFPGPGDKYKHPFSREQHRRLAGELAAMGPIRVVCRFYDDPLIRELYPAPVWEWRHLEGGRKQSNAAAPEVLLVKGGSA